MSPLEYLATLPSAKIRSNSLGLRCWKNGVFLNCCNHQWYIMLMYAHGRPPEPESEFSDGPACGLETETGAKNRCYATHTRDKTGSHGCQRHRDPYLQMTIICITCKSCYLMYQDVIWNQQGVRRKIGFQAHEDEAWMRTSLPVVPSLASDHGRQCTTVHSINCHHPHQCSQPQAPRAQRP